jgi:protein-tyrosine phosphatase
MGAAEPVRSTVRLEGTPNFRDLGGLTTVDGRRVRPGLLFRSEGPAYLGANDVATLQGLGIRTVCDLRSEGERRTHPNHWTDDGSLLNIEVDIDVRVVGNKAWDLMRANPTVAGGRAAMMYNYRAMGRAMERPFRQLVDHLLEGSRVPVLIHCTAGKDRTGVVIALLLHALGVTTPEIEADYVLSARHMGVTRFAEGLRRMFDDLGIVDPPSELLAMVVGVEAPYLHCAIEEIVRDSSTLERFFEERIGLNKSRRAALQDMFIEAPPESGL